MIDVFLIPIVAIVGTFATISIGLVAHYVYLIERLKAENALKQDMLLRGYSAEEIAQVITARVRSPWSVCSHRPSKGMEAKKAA